MGNNIAGIITMLVMFLIYIPLLILSIYVMILYIKLGRRGIKALDIYLAKEEKKINE